MTPLSPIGVPPKIFVREIHLYSGKSADAPVAHPNFSFQPLHVRIRRRVLTHADLRREGTHARTPPPTPATPLRVQPSYRRPRSVAGHRPSVAHDTEPTLGPPGKSADNSFRKAWYLGPPERGWQALCICGAAVLVEMMLTLSNGVSESRRFRTLLRDRPGIRARGWGSSGRGGWD